MWFRLEVAGCANVGSLGVGDWHSVFLCGFFGPHPLLQLIASVLFELAVVVETRATLVCNKQVVIHIASNQMFQERITHIKVDCHFVQDLTVANKIKDSTCQDQADIFTKSHLPTHFKHMVCKLDMHHVYTPFWGSLNDRELYVIYVLWCSF